MPVASPSESTAQSRRTRRTKKQRKWPAWSRLAAVRPRSVTRRKARADAQTAPTIATLADEFLTDRRAKKKAATVDEYERLLDKDVMPTLGSVRVAALARAQVAKLHLAMSDRPYLANRALAILAAMLRFAELHEHRPTGTNSCTGIELYPERSRERFLTDEELKRFGAALTKAE